MRFFKRKTNELAFSIDLNWEMSGKGLFLKGWVLDSQPLTLECDGRDHTFVSPFLPRPDVNARFGLSSDQLLGDQLFGFSLLLPAMVVGARLALRSGSSVIWKREGTEKLSNEEQNYLEHYLQASAGLIRAETIVTALFRENCRKYPKEVSLLVRDDIGYTPTLIEGRICVGLDDLHCLAFSGSRYQTDASFEPHIRAKSTVEYILSINRSPLNIECKKASLSLIIPVYNAVDACRACLESLVRIEGFEDYQVIIVDDYSDSYTADFLRSFAQRYSNITCVRHSQNGGFIKACCTGLEHSNEGSDIVLLNSDIVLTTRCISLLRDAVHSRKNIAAGSCLSTNSPNCQIDLPGGYSLERLARFIEEHHEPKVPTLITPEGQCLYLKRWAIEAFGFFDPVFEEGFGEESDLCMRFFCAGADTVCADNALIFHRKSASFGLEQGEELKRKHWPIFNERWGPYHRAMHEEFMRRTPFAEIRSSVAQLSPLDPPSEELSFPQRKIEVSYSSEQGLSDILDGVEVVFLLPNTYVGGGTLSVLQHVEEMNLRGVEARAIALWAPFHTRFPSTSGVLPVPAAQLDRLRWGSQKVIATFWLTAYVLEELQRAYSGIDPYYYVQGYEPLFYGEKDHISRTEAGETYRLGFPTIVKSMHLQKTLLEEHQISAKKIAAGINRFVFYPGTQDQDHRQIRIAAYYRPSTPDRGAAMLTAVVRELLEQRTNLKIVLFGEDIDSPLDLVGDIESLGMIEQSRVAQLYRNTDIAFDFAEFHGFGRVGIESMCCGAVPVLTKSGGVEEYARDFENAMLGGTLNSLVQKTLALIDSKELRMKLRAGALKTSMQFSEQKATSDWLDILGLNGAVNNNLADRPITKEH